MPAPPTGPRLPGGRRLQVLRQPGTYLAATVTYGRGPEAYVDYAQAQRHKGFEKVQVTFDDQPDDQAHRGRRNRDGAV